MAPEIPISTRLQAEDVHPLPRQRISHQTVEAWKKIEYCCRRTRHIDIRLFNIKDKLSQEGIEVVYCPTKKMVADFFTKPLQGSQFRFLRRIVLGMEPMSSLDLLGACWKTWKTRHARIPSFHGQGGRTSATKNVCICRHRKLTTDAARTFCKNILHFQHV